LGGGEKEAYLVLHFMTQTGGSWLMCTYAFVKQDSLLIYADHLQMHVFS